MESRKWKVESWKVEKRKWKVGKWKKESGKRFFELAHLIFCPLSFLWQGRLFFGAKVFFCAQKPFAITVLCQTVYAETLLRFFFGAKSEKYAFQRKTCGAPRLYS